MRLVMLLMWAWMVFVMSVAVVVMRLSRSLALQLPVAESIKQQEGYSYDEHDDNYLQLVAETVRLVVVGMGAMMGSDQLVHLLYL